MKVSFTDDHTSCNLSLYCFFSVKITPNFNLYCVVPICQKVGEKGLNNSQHCRNSNVACCCVCVSLVCKQIQQLPTTRTKMQQGVQTDAICNIQQFWELLGNNELRLFAWG